MKEGQDGRNPQRRLYFAAKIAGVNVDDLADYLVVEGIQNRQLVTAQRHYKPLCK